MLQIVLDPLSRFKNLSNKITSERGFGSLDYLSLILSAIKMIKGISPKQGDMDRVLPTGTASVHAWIMLEVL